MSGQCVVTGTYYPIMPDLANTGAPYAPQPGLAWPTARAPSPRVEVFLSHSCDDLQHVALVKRQIEALGVDVYLAEHDLRPGTSIAAKVQEAIKRCHAVVVLITGNSIDSSFVQQEVGIARAFEKPVVPIVENAVDISRLGILREVEYLELDLRQPRGSAGEDQR